MQASQRADQRASGIGAARQLCELHVANVVWPRPQGLNCGDDALSCFAQGRCPAVPYVCAASGSKSVFAIQLAMRTSSFWIGIHSLAACTGHSSAACHGRPNCVSFPLGQNSTAMHSSSLLKQIRAAESGYLAVMGRIAAKQGQERCAPAADGREMAQCTRSPFSATS